MLSFAYGIPPGELMSRVTSSEFRELMDYAKEFGLPDSWLQTGVICSAVANSQGGKTSPSDFMPTRKQAMSLEEKAKALANG